MIKSKLPHRQNPKPKQERQSAAARISCYFCGSVLVILQISQLLKLNFRSFVQLLSLCIAKVKERFCFKAEHSRNNIVRKSLYCDIKFFGRCVKESSYSGKFVFNICHFGLQLHKVLAGFKIGISFQLDV